MRQPRRKRTSRAAAGHARSGRRTPDAGGAFQKLVDTMARLRGPRGCAWDREQTLASLRPHLLEETYEVLDAIDRGDHAALEGEIGDLLLEAVFLAQICADERRFTVSDSLKSITSKLVRRHPHVFGRSANALSPAEVRGQWEQIKAREQQARGERKTVLGGVKRSLPALLRAYEIGSRAASVGFDWARAQDVIEKIREEVDELQRALENAEGAARTAEEMWDLLFALANLARKLGVEPESALRQANEKFIGRFEELERRLEADGRSVHAASLDEMEMHWQRLKGGAKAATFPRK
jgi:MazG family protein